MKIIFVIGMGMKFLAIQKQKEAVKNFVSMGKNLF